MVHDMLANYQQRDPLLQPNHGRCVATKPGRVQRPGRVHAPSCVRPCCGVEPIRSELSQAEPSRAEPSQAKPSRAEPSRAKLVCAGLVQQSWPCCQGQIVHNSTARNHRTRMLGVAAGTRKLQQNEKSKK
jgi:hypothetical protein